jgi:serine/threonine-protein kinase RsbW
MVKYEFTYLSTLESADRMLDDLLAVFQEHGLAKHLVHRVSVAVSEAFTNALLHGNRQQADKAIIIKLAINEGEVCADIIDQGKRGLEQIRGKAPATSTGEGGRGIDLIRHYADTAVFAASEDGGLQVHLVFVRCSEKDSVTS